MLLKKYPLFYFFMFAFLFSCILWIPLLYGHFALGWTSWEGNSWTNFRTMLGILGSLGPALSALVMIYLTEGETKVKAVFKSAVQWKFSLVWWLTALYGWWVLCSLLTLILNLSDFYTVAKNLLFSLINIPAMIFVLQLPLLIGMFGEEAGWRGYALPKLLQRYHPITASLILAFPWIFWHLPLFVFQEWRENASMFEFFRDYILLVVPLTLIFTWGFQKTKGSLLFAILLHKSFNLTFNAFSIALGLNEEAETILTHWSIIALWLIAGIISIRYYIEKKV